jgi:hypothetical protein
VSNIFNIHKKATSEDGKKALIKIIQSQNRMVIRNTFKMPCACCQREARIEWLYKCFYCGVWFCHKCAEEHFNIEKKIIAERDKRCSGYKVFPDGSECKGCPDCEDNQ